MRKENHEATSEGQDALYRKQSKETFESMPVKIIANH